MIKSMPIIKTGNSFNEFRNLYIDKIDRFIGAFFTNKIKRSASPLNKDMYRLLADFCLRKGKRIRPVILILSYCGYKKSGKNLDEVIKIASAIEMMHSFLLIQDDIIDKSELRRGEKTLHILCRERYSDKTRNAGIGNDIALVLTDVLFSCAVEIISGAKIKQKIKDHFLSQFAATYEQTAWGQILDSLNSLPVKIDADSSDPMEIGILKTAYYTILGPMLMGYRLSGKKNSETEKKIKAFSIPLGLAFQIRDDILGIFGRKEETGKPSDSDIREGKYTLLVQDTIKNLPEKEGARFIKIFTKARKSDKDISCIRNMIQKSGAPEKSHDKIKKLTDTARKNLEPLNMKKKEMLLLAGLIDLIGEE
jgi:geranylgeranyl diphosphate synthase type I